MPNVSNQAKRPKLILKEFISLLKKNLTENRKLSWANIAKFYHVLDNQSDFNILSEFVDKLKSNAKYQFQLSQKQSHETIGLFKEAWSNLSMQIEYDTKYAADFHSIKNTTTDSTEILCNHFENYAANDNWSMINIELVNKLYTTNTKTSNYEFDSNSSYEQQATVLKFVENFKANLNSWSKIFVDILYKPEETKNELIKYEMKLVDAYKLDYMFFDIKNNKNWKKVSFFIG
jgi:hypothetical protein